MYSTPAMVLRWRLVWRAEISVSRRMVPSASGQVGCFLGESLIGTAMVAVSDAPLALSKPKDISSSMEGSSLPSAPFRARPVSSMVPESPVALSVSEMEPVLELLVAVWVLVTGFWVTVMRGARDRPDRPASSSRPSSSSSP